MHKNKLCLITALALIILLLIPFTALAALNFTDADEIEHKEAVTALVALGVMAGRDDGSFDPAGSITRAELAKILTIIETGGTLPDLANTNTTPFTDLATPTSAWAQGFISFCYTEKIVNGRTETSYEPDASVIPLEAAKMLLAAAGYDPVIEGMVGANWAANTYNLANSVGLFKNVGQIDMNAPLSREDAAQMAYNLLFVEMVEYIIEPAIDANGNLTTVSTRNKLLVDDKPVTVLEYVFKQMQTSGIIVSNEQASLIDTKANDYDLTTVKLSGSDEIIELAIASSWDMLGQEVSFFYNANSVNGVSPVPVMVDLSLTDNQVYRSDARPINNAIDDESDIIADMLTTDSLDFDYDNLELYVNFGQDLNQAITDIDGIATAISNALPLMNINYATANIYRYFIDNNGDQKIDIVSYIIEGFGIVDTKDDEEVNINIYSQQEVNYDADNTIGYDDFEEDDYVNYWQFDDKLIAQPAEMLSGSFDAISAKDTIVIDGTEYDFASRNFVYNEGLGMLMGIPFQLEQDIWGMLDSLGRVILLDGEVQVSSQIALQTDYSKSLTGSEYVSLILGDGSNMSTLRVGEIKTEAYLPQLDDVLVQVISDENSDILIDLSGDILYNKAINAVTANNAQGLISIETGSADIKLGSPMFNGSTSDISSIIADKDTLLFHKEANGSINVYVGINNMPTIINYNIANDIFDKEFAAGMAYQALVVEDNGSYKALAIYINSHSYIERTVNDSCPPGWCD